mmetsp:Transcript_27328/g.63463  ORF Transcript_27328/g.63463 Transcript_27328/m.63463 type:complete len:242 (-) Transcript_27328:569-1294(-)
MDWVLLDLCVVRSHSLHGFIWSQTTMRQGQLASATGEKRTSPSLGGLLGVIFDFQSFTDEVSVDSQHDRVNHSFVTCIGHKWNTSIGGPMVATGGPPRDAQLQELDSILDIFHECSLHGYTSVQKSDVARSVESPVLSCAMCFHRCRRLRCLFCLVACRQTFFSPHRVWTDWSHIRSRPVLSSLPLILPCCLDGILPKHSESFSALQERHLVLCFQLDPQSFFLCFVSDASFLRHIFYLQH